MYDDAVPRVQFCAEPIAEVSLLDEPIHCQRPKHETGLHRHQVPGYKVEWYTTPHGVTHVYYRGQ